MALRAVLLDFDGVIADTENHHIAAWQRTLAALGWQVPDEVAARSADVDDREFLRDLLAAQQITDGDIDGWVRKKQALTISMLRDAPRVYPGVQELVRQLRGRVRLAVVAGTWRENIEVVLSTSGLLAAFELIVGKEDVRSVKPDPEAYLLALSRLGLMPAKPWRSKILQLAWPPPVPPGFRESPSDIVANSANGLAIPPTSLDSSPYLGSYGTWDSRRET